MVSMMSVSHDLVADDVEYEGDSIYQILMRRAWRNEKMEHRFSV